MPQATRSSGRTARPGSRGQGTSPGPPPRRAADQTSTGSPPRRPRRRTGRTDRRGPTVTPPRRRERGTHRRPADDPHAWLRSRPIVGFGRDVKRPALEAAREDHVGLGLEHVLRRLDTTEDALEVAGVAGPGLDQVVGLTGGVGTFLVLADRGEGLGQVVADGA